MRVLPVRRFQPPVPRAAELPPFTPPAVAKETTTDDYHGEAIADPYRWLEDQDGERTAAFVREQNGAARAWLDALPERDELREQLQERWNFPRTGAPERAGARWFWQHNDGLQNQGVWFVADTPDAAGEVLLDPNTLSSDGTTALAGFRPSHDGSHVAYAVATRGSDWQEWHVLDTAQKRVLPDTLRWAKFTQASWTHDGKGFFYQRFPAPQDGQVYEASNQSPQLCYHELGTEQAADRVVYERPDEPRWLFGTEVTHDGHFLVLTLSEGSSRQNRVAWIDLREAGWPVRALRMNGDARYEFVGNQGDTFWLRTDLEAPRGRLVALDRTQPAAEPTTVIAEAKETLQAVQHCGGKFVCTWLADAAHRLTVHATDGKQAAEITLPALGSVGAVTGDPADQQVFCVFQSFVHAPTVLRHDLAANTTASWRGVESGFDPSGFVTERRYLQSRDGTRLCLFLTHRQGLLQDGSHPTLLYGYGGFAQSMVPTFSVPNLVFVERGGIYAHAVLRGGGEYGEEWHRAGMLGQKQNCFDDFVACAEFLQRNKFTSRAKLAIHGRSNGGLLVGAVLAQRPELFAAAIPEVGVLDMLRYHTFTIGWAWAGEYGRSDDRDAFAWLRAYSPLHNLKAGASYPATLVMTGDHDDRVLPGHSYKFAATLQQAQGGKAPILLRVEPAAGHGAGKPVHKQIDEAVDRLAFLAAALGT